MKTVLHAVPRTVALAAVLLTTTTTGAVLAGTEPAPSRTAAAKASAAAKANSAAKASVGAEVDAKTDSGNISAEHAVAAQEAAAEDPLANVKHTKGPATLDLGDGISLQLPEGFVLVDPSEIAESLRKGGSSMEGVKGLVLSLTEPDVELLARYKAEGYVSDSDADKLDASELLQSYKLGTEQQNIVRKANNLPPMTVDGWRATPRYDRATRTLSWGLNAHDSEGGVVNLLVNKLSRRGYLEMQIVAPPSKADGALVVMQPVIDAATFTAGHRYEDFDSSTDKSSGNGLRALVLGGVGVAVAKKTGLLIIILAFLKKGGVLLFVPIIGFFKRLFGRGKDLAHSDAVSGTSPATANPVAAQDFAVEADAPATPAKDASSQS